MGSCNHQVCFLTLPAKFQFMSVAENLLRLKSEIPDHVKIVAVSKTHTIGEILEVYHTGHRVFGENRVQELIDKQPLLPSDIEWHFIGHLQTNKVKFIAPFVSVIHSIDSLKLLSEVHKQAEKSNRIIDCLLQFHIAEEESKFGLNLGEASQLLDSASFQSMKFVRIRGVMGMATFTENEQQVRKEFRNLNAHFHFLKKKYFQNDPGFTDISMGMSGDYCIAVEEGSTIVRIGTAIFGERNLV